MTPSHPYDLEAAIMDFFTLKSTDRKTCDTTAEQLVGGRAAPVAIQGNCSYTVYAGPQAEFVVQFRPKSLSLTLGNNKIARRIHGPLVPEIDECCQLGDEDQGEPLIVYIMPRMQGTSYLDFTRMNAMPNNSKEMKACRKALMADAAKFFSTSWKSPQPVTVDFRKNLEYKFCEDLALLSERLPSRFSPSVQKCLDSMERVLSLPAVLLHNDFSTANIIVDEISCSLVGVLDWGEAGICTFGQNLHFIQNLTCQLDPNEGWKPLDDFGALQTTFWATLQDEAGGLPAETMETIKIASVMGLLLYRGLYPTPSTYAHAYADL
ncbi:hypothetical protein O1611_g4183 [Lasiodiplodia mahajangana]|uniref:Uncharacterized protein n=1 Tax=Lasiodiplodia mahajangana TaxID=1108764 RepID=A0ACC2JPQ8_9PEZI|nr:hypothetical protein O1611_g4183 [Lasiodiplodia mahajangana]